MRGAADVRGEGSTHPLLAACLKGAEFGRIRRLEGFRKGKHFEPDSHHEAASAFVRRVGADAVAERAEALYRQLREVFGWKRRELVYTCEEGGATIQTPRFSVEWSVDQDPDEARQFVLAVSVAGFRDLEVLLESEFQEVFRPHCRAVEIELAEPIDLEAHIDALEENDRVAEILDYPPDASWLSISLPKPSVRLELSRERARFVLPQGGDLGMLLEGTVQLLRAVGQASPDLFPGLELSC